MMVMGMLARRGPRGKMPGDSKRTTIGIIFILFTYKDARNGS